MWQRSYSGFDIRLAADALRSSNWRRRLLSLELNLSVSSYVKVLTEALSDPVNPSVLRELRMPDVGFNADDNAALLEMLCVNRSLALLELRGVNPRDPKTHRLIDAAQVIDAQARLEAASREQFAANVPPLKLPAEAKVALLSVVSGSRASDAVVRSSLDSYLLSLTFAFAGGRAPRRIAWNVDIENRHYQRLSRREVQCPSRRS